METLIEQLKARGFGALTGESVYTRTDGSGWVTVQFIRGRVSVGVTILSVGELDRWFPGDVTIEQVESFITRARRIIAEWDTMEVSFGEVPSERV